MRDMQLENCTSSEEMEVFEARRCNNRIIKVVSTSNKQEQTRRVRSQAEANDRTLSSSCRRPNVEVPMTTSCKIPDKAAQVSRGHYVRWRSDLASARREKLRSPEKDVDRKQLDTKSLDLSISNNTMMTSDTSRSMNLSTTARYRTSDAKTRRLCHRDPGERRPIASFVTLCTVLMFIYFINDYPHQHKPMLSSFCPLIKTVEASLIIGDSAIEIQEVDSGSQPQVENTNPLEEQSQQQQQQQQHQQQLEHNQLGSVEQQPSIILGSTNDGQVASSLDNRLASAEQHLNTPELIIDQHQPATNQRPLPSGSSSNNLQMPGPLPPISSNHNNKQDDITDGDKNSRHNHDYDINELNRQAEKDALGRMLKTQPSLSPSDNDKTIAGKVVDFELVPAGGHNKAKIKKKKKKKVMKKKEKKEEEMFKKWGKKKKSEKKAMENEEKKHMKKKKEEGRVW